jgi:hypothetical protein
MNPKTRILVAGIAAGAAWALFLSALFIVAQIFRGEVTDPGMMVVAMVLAIAGEYARRFGFITIRSVMSELRIEP